jgi:hypothetical protein
MPLILVLVGLIVSFAQRVQARFDPSDSERIDSEQFNNSESWNDKNSYRYPVSWDRQWRLSEFGYRVNAGSLNASRFNYEDEVKIAPRPLETFTASFSQLRREDLVENVLEREIRVGWGFLQGMRLSLLGDVNTLKEFGDLGVALVIDESPGSMTEVYAWSVDLYYQSKKSDEEASRTNEAKTYGFKSEHTEGPGKLGWRARFEWDTPIDWTLPTEGWRYEYHRRMFDGRLNVLWNPGDVFYGSAFWERKYERKSSLVELSRRIDFKSMLRDTVILEVGLESEWENKELWVLALQRIWRRVNYEHSAEFSKGTIHQESRSPDHVLRNEWGFILTRSVPISDDWSLQQGVMMNDVFISEDHRRWKRFEVKYQLLFDLELNDRTRFGLNTTWDVDQLIVDYPYPKEKPFRPWGGGDLQFMMRF